MTIFTFSEIADAIKTQGYRYLCMQSIDGQLLIPANNQNTKPDVKLKELEKKLAAKIYPDGYYLIECRYGTRQKAKPDVYTVVKGKADGLGEPPTVPPPAAKASDAFGPSVISFKEALEMKNQITRLEMEKLALEKEVTELTEKIADLEDELSAEPPPEEKADLAESEQGVNKVVKDVSSYISTLLESAMPILDTHFQLKDRELKLKELAAVGPYLQNGNGAPAPAQQQQQEEMTEEQTKQFWEEMAQLKVADPDKFNEIMQQMYGTAG